VSAMPRSRLGPRLTVVAALMAAAGTAGLAGATSVKAVSVTQLPLQAGELTGFHVTAPATLIPTAAGFASQLGTPAEAAKLRRAGFRQASSEQLAGPAKAVAFSFVMQFRDAAAARSEVRRVYRRDLGDKTAIPRAASVPGIPGALGLAQDFKKSSTDQSYVIFADGPYEYFSTILGAGAQKSPTMAKLIAAARAQYKRVHGQAAGARG